MRTDVRATSKLAAAILLFFNFLVMSFSALLFALSLWIISSPNTLSVTLKALANSTINALLPTEVLSVQLGIAIGVIAVFLFFVSFMGFYGAINHSPFLLFMYSTLNLLMLLLECALLYYFSSSLIEKGLQEQDGQWTHALRLVYRCCEYNTTDFTVSKLPWSCCDVESNRKNCTAFNKYQQDCRETITAWLYRYQGAIYATLVVVHVVLSSCSLMRRASSASRSHT